MSMLAGISLHSYTPFISHLNILESKRNDFPFPPLCSGLDEGLTEC